MKKTVELYTDGSCKKNPGPGGYCAILCYNNNEKIIKDGEENTTNNRMELLSVIKGLSALKESCIVELHSDSKYVIDALSKGWAISWKQKGWIKSDKKPALNIDLWEELLNLVSYHELNYHWIKGHNGHPYNERCDRMAVLEAEKFTNK